MTPPDALIILMALLLDLVLGDPRWLPHPVIMIGRLITFLDHALRCPWLNLRLAGTMLLLIVVGSSAGVTWLLLKGMNHLHPLCGLFGSVVIAATCLAARSLHVESARVATALKNGDLPAARTNLSWIVGRDTDQLNEPEIWRAVVETVAENTADGVIAPLFWLTVGGPVAAIAFKAVSTLDSMVGYRNPRYMQLGWASARMDDLLNFIPARLTAFLIIVAAAISGHSAGSALRIFLRDRHKHPSPNSAHPEAAAAGALRVQLGGSASYGGVVSCKQQLGDPERALDGRSYRGMIQLMYISTFLMAAACIAAACYLRGFRVPSL